MRDVQGLIVAVVLAAGLVSAVSGCGGGSTEVAAAAADVESSEDREATTEPDDACCPPASDAATEARATELEASGGNAPESPPRPAIPDVVLTDQHGETHRFYTDLLKGKLVLINAVFTSCTGTCPAQTSIFAGVQRHLGERLGRDVVMLSVSLDPVTDTPEKLREFAERYGAGPGWYFLTGSQPDVVRALKSMDLYSPRPQDHTPIAAVGNEATGVWMKVINLTDPHALVTRLDTVKELTLEDVVRRPAGGG